MCYLSIALHTVFTYLETVCGIKKEYEGECFQKKYANYGVTDKRSWAQTITIYPMIYIIVNLDHNTMYI